MIITGYGNYEGLGVISLDRRKLITSAPTPSVSLPLAPGATSAATTLLAATKPRIISPTAATTVLRATQPLSVTKAIAAAKSPLAITSPKLMTPLPSSAYPTPTSAPTATKAFSFTPEAAPLPPPPSAPPPAMQMSVPSGIHLPGSPTGQPGYRAPGLPIPPGATTGYPTGVPKAGGPGGAGVAQAITAGLLPQFAPGQTPQSIVQPELQPCPPGTLPGKAPGQCFPKDVSSMTPQEAMIASQSLYSPTGARVSPWATSGTLSKVAVDNTVPGDDANAEEAAVAAKSSLLLPLAIGGAALLALKFLK